MRVAVIDDEREERERMQSFLERFAEEFSRKIEVSQFTCGDELLREYSYDFDILIFDIDMPGTSGLDTAREIRKKDENVVILFVTNMAQFAVEGYAVDAMDFMVKPISYDNLRLKLDRALKKLEGRREDRLIVHGKGGPVVVTVPEIRYVEVTNHMLTFHTAEGATKATGSLKSLEQRLAGHDFSRANSCYLINLRYVQGVDDGMVAVGGKRLPISRARRKAFMRDLADYLGGRV